jgi:hypothetical protein
MRVYCEILQKLIIFVRHVGFRVDPAVDGQNAVSGEFSTALNEIN